MLPRDSEAGAEAGAPTPGPPSIGRPALASEIEEDSGEPAPSQPLLGIKGNRISSSSASLMPGGSSADASASKGSPRPAGAALTAGPLHPTNGGTWVGESRPAGAGKRVHFEVEEGPGGEEGGFSYSESSGFIGALRRFVMWVLSFTIPGMGMFSEAYFVFSIGNLRGIFSEAYPECWKDHATCSKDLVHTLTYSQVGGIILGQLGIGVFADKLGRKWGSILIAAIMLVFGILIAASSGSDSGGLFLMFTISQALFGVGVGGEYPVASASASERAEQSRHLQRRRGETVVLTFSMQGWGNLANTAVIVGLMAAFRQSQPPYNQSSLAAVWRLSYIIGLIPIAFMFVWRIWFLRESEVWKRGKQSNAALAAAAAAGGGAPARNRLLLRHYWHRVLGTAGSWFVWDFAFYGNKLFQSTFIAVINPGATLQQALLWTLLNSAVALVGYYFAAFTVDKPWMGRKRMQAMGFLWISVLFGACAAFYPTLVGRGIHLFQFLYYFSSFWGQFGPNATTWLLPAEIVPTEARSMCHGLASAVGKAGALVAGVAFGLVDDRTKFLISALCGLAGVVLTLALIPDVTGLDLREGDARWQALLESSGEPYSGEAVNPRHLSYVEKLLGYGEAYCAGSGGAAVAGTANAGTAIGGTDNGGTANGRKEAGNVELGVRTRDEGASGV